MIITARMENYVLYFKKLVVVYKFDIVIINIFTFLYILMHFESKFKDSLELQITYYMHDLDYIAS